MVGITLFLTLFAFAFGFFIKDMLWWYSSENERVFDQVTANIYRFRGMGTTTTPSKMKYAAVEESDGQLWLIPENTFKNRFKRLP